LDRDAAVLPGGHRPLFHFIRPEFSGLFFLLGL